MHQWLHVSSNNIQNNIDFMIYIFIDDYLAHYVALSGQHIELLWVSKLGMSIQGYVYIFTRWSWGDVHKWSRIAYLTSLQTKSL
jgi:hypothetical protein